MDIEIAHTHVGAIQFRQEPPTAQRTANGFLINLPITIRLRPTPVKGLIPMLSGLRGTLLVPDDKRGLFEIGRFRSDALYHGARDDHQFPATVEWHGALSSLAEFEQRRASKPPAWQVRIAGEIYLLSSVPNHARQLGDVPDTFHGQETLNIPSEIWTTLLQQLGVLDLVLVHIPLPEPTPGPMTPVWSALQQARDDFAAGGAAGWRSCGIHLRQALTDWDIVQKLDTGKGITDKSKLTKDQRLDTLRYHLREFTHIAGHPEPAIAKTWTRDDALLALSATCALLNAKKP
jgi:hypothetical protein